MPDLPTFSTPDPTRDGLTGKTWQLIEERVFAYERDYQAGTARPLSEYLPGGNVALRQAVLVELVKVDLELRWGQDQRMRLEDYCRQYAELGSVEELPPDLVYEAYRVACQHGDVDSAERFCEHYPRQRDAVLSMANRTFTYSSSLVRQKPKLHFSVGTRHGDFELLAALGEGAFGAVYLARQISLARQVALKISANRGCEARTMASLEHDHIVQVFSEFTDPELDVRFLCMQYVPGTTLEESSADGRMVPGPTGTEKRLSKRLMIFRRGRRSFKQPRLRNVSCWKSRTWWKRSHGWELGWPTRSPYAHQQGVLHRDIKPDNILISQFGRPLLADFNLSLDIHESMGTTAAMFGGSLGYMSPEHLDAFNPTNVTTPDSVDERSDIYSLGIVLFEAVTLPPTFHGLAAGGRTGRRPRGDGQ